MQFSAGVDEQERPDHTSARRADYDSRDHQPVLAWILVVEGFDS
jgi:hypothetical protein